jgi:hypothetical protein
MALPLMHEMFYPGKQPAEELEHPNFCIDLTFDYSYNIR